ncbi:MAG TPA: hypothetical protein VGE54_10625 [Brevundimonas sp.]
MNGLRFGLRMVSRISRILLLVAAAAVVWQLVTGKADQAMFGFMAVYAAACGAAYLLCELGLRMLKAR